MTDSRISDLNNITTIADTDIVEIVDISDYTMSATGTNKKVTISALKDTFTPEDSDAVIEGSTNLYLTQTLKTKLEGIEDGAEVNAIENVTSTNPTNSLIKQIVDRIVTLKNIEAGNNISISDNNDTLTISTDSVFTGAILASIVNDTPNGFLPCKGGAISRVDYADLFNIIGTSFGSGDGSTTFNLPDYRGRFLRGLGGNSTSNFYTPQGDAIRNITGSCSSRNGYGDTYHTIANQTGAFIAGTARNTYTTARAAAVLTCYDMGFDASKVVPTANENRPVNCPVNWFIKY